MSQDAYSFRNNPSVLFEKDMRDICQSVFRSTAVSSVAYSRHYYDGSRAEIWSDSSALIDVFILKGYVTRTYTVQLYSKPEEFIYLPARLDKYNVKLKQKYINLLEDLRINYNLTHPLNFAVKNDDYMEYLLFYVPDSPAYSINDHLNNFDIYRKFYHEFKEKASHLIDKVEEDRIVKPLPTSKRIIAEPYRKFNRGFQALSKQEMRLVQDVVNGLTMKNNTIGVTKTTADSYMKNIRAKLDVSNLAQLMAKYYEWKYKGN